MPEAPNPSRGTWQRLNNLNVVASISVALVTLVGGLASPGVRQWFSTSRLPLQVLFDVRPLTVGPGQSVVLSWKVENAERVVIEPSGLVGTVQLQGTRRIPVRSSTTFTLRAYASGIEPIPVSRTVQVTEAVVLPKPASRWVEKRNSTDSSGPADEQGVQQVTDHSVSDNQRTPGPVITRVSPIIPTGNQTVFIRGSGFGRHDPYNGCTNLLRVVDVANGWHIGLNAAGDGGCPEGEWPLYVKSWTDDEIVIGGFPGYGIVGLLQGLRVFRVGDVVMITVANAQGKGIVNADPNLKGGPVGKFSVTVSDSN